MVKRFSETRDELSTTWNPKVMSRCLSAPDVTSLHHCLQNHNQYCTTLIWIQALDINRPDFLLLSIKQMFIIVVLATLSSTVHNGKYLDLYHWRNISFSCLFMRQWCRCVASGADRHLNITFELQVIENSYLVTKNHLTIPRSPFFINYFFCYLFPYFLEKRSAILSSPFFIY